MATYNEIVFSLLWSIWTIKLKLYSKMGSYSGRTKFGGLSRICCLGSISYIRGILYTGIWRLPICCTPIREYWKFVILGWLGGYQPQRWPKKLLVYHIGLHNCWWVQLFTRQKLMYGQLGVSLLNSFLAIQYSKEKLKFSNLMLFLE